MFKKLFMAVAFFGTGFVAGVILKNSIDNLLGYEDETGDVDWDSIEADDALEGVWD